MNIYCPHPTDQSPSHLCGAKNNPGVLFAKNFTKIRQSRLVKIGKCETAPHHSQQNKKPNPIKTQIDADQTEPNPKPTKSTVIVGERRRSSNPKKRWRGGAKVVAAAAATPTNVANATASPKAPATRPLRSGAQLKPFSSKIRSKIHFPQKFAEKTFPKTFSPKFAQNAHRLARWYAQKWRAGWTVTESKWAPNSGGGRQRAKVGGGSVNGEAESVAVGAQLDALSKLCVKRIPKLQQQTQSPKTPKSQNIPLQLESERLCRRNGVAKLASPNWSAEKCAFRFALKLGDCSRFV
jgi:hypothetical protein